MPSFFAFDQKYRFLLNYACFWDGKRQVGSSAPNHLLTTTIQLKKRS
jgi:hypothetical protein